MKQENQPLEITTNEEFEKCKRPLRILLYGLCLFGANYALQESDIAPYVVEQAGNAVTAVGAAGMLIYSLYNMHIKPYIKKNSEVEKRLCL